MLPKGRPHRLTLLATSVNVITPFWPGIFRAHETRPIISVLFQFYRISRKNKNTTKNLKSQHKPDVAHAKLKPDTIWLPSSKSEGNNTGLIGILFHLFFFGWKIYIFVYIHPVLSFQIPHIVWLPVLIPLARSLRPLPDSIRTHINQLHLQPFVVLSRHATWCGFLLHHSLGAANVR